jgi:integrase/recombinase XerD
VTAYNCISKLRRVASLIAPDADFSWLSDIENDLAFVMEPRSKFERFVFTDVLVEAGLTLASEAQRSAKDALSHARGVRNGLMIALLAAYPIRLKNFAGLSVGQTFKWDQGSWWITLPRKTTKTRRPDDRRVDRLFYRAIDLYLEQSRPTLIGKAPDEGALWISSRTGRGLTKKNLGILISKITLGAVGIDVSPHLFRTAGASTSAHYAGELRHLGTALLGHTDPRITEDHYRRVSSINASKTYAAIIQSVVGSSQ